MGERHKRLRVTHKELAETPGIEMRTLIFLSVKIFFFFFIYMENMDRESPIIIVNKFHQNI